MKLKISKLFLFGFLLFFTVNCSKDTNQVKNLNLSINLTSQSDCKSNKSAQTIGNTPNSQSCIEYSFEAATKKLIIRHVNAGFNCCPGKVTCSVLFRNDSIIVHETEESPKCNCDCLYDLDMEVNGVEPGKYQFQVIEPYVGNEERLAFELDLLTKVQGSCCVQRTQYPWGQ